MKYFFPFLMIVFLFGCGKDKYRIITVTGDIKPIEIGKTLHHEHLLVDFIGADSTGYFRWDKNEVVNKVLPYLIEIKEAGYKTLVDATPEFLGRDPLLLKMLSEKSGVQLITNTGLYAAYKKHLPAYFYEETAEQLSKRWINEYNNNIENTGVYPGFIKISVERTPLENMHRKLVKAGCLTHLETGLTIMSHTGLAVPAFQQLEILKENGIHPSAFIWTHAHNEQDHSKHIEAARMGAWIAFDNFHEGRLERFVYLLSSMKEKGLLNKVLLSHDAGWFDPAKPEGGDFRGFMEIENLLIPALKKHGFSQEDIDQLMIKNPAKAFTVKIRTI